jgi:O-antigen/teichoic acid export membrane protein
MREVVRQWFRSNPLLKVIRIAIAVFVIGLAFLVVSKESGNLLVVVSAIVIAGTVVFGILWFGFEVVWSWAMRHILTEQESKGDKPPN